MITSAQNPLIKEFRRLRRDKHARQATNVFIVEGIQGVVAAIQRAAPLQIILYAPERLTSEIAHTAIRTAQARGIRCEAVAANLFETLSERDNPAGIAALVQRPNRAQSTFPATPTGLYVGLFEISDPGNLGTILRTVDAVAGDALFLVGATVDPYHPTAVKASAGTIFALPVVPVPDLTALVHWCQQANVTIVATSDQAPQPYWSYTYPSPLLVLMGSEAHGLPSNLLTTLPNVVSIPMLGSADSLNLGVATALVLYEVRRQRLTAPTSL